MSFYDDYFGQFFDEVDDEKTEQAINDILSKNEKELSESESILREEIAKMENELNHKKESDALVEHKKENMFSEVEEEEVDDGEVEQAFRVFEEQMKKQEEEKEEQLESLKRLADLIYRNEEPTPKKLIDASDTKAEDNYLLTDEGDIEFVIDEALDEILSSPKMDDDYIEYVNHPEHYQGHNYEVIDIIEDYDLGFHDGSAVKYILRAGKKGEAKEDYEKAIWFLERLISNEENE